jgi:hypothetical protein
MSTSIHIKEMPVAVFDILGFGKMMNELPIEEIFKKIILLQPVYEEIINKSYQALIDFYKKDIKINIDKIVIFKIISDTIIIYINPIVFRVSNPEMKTMNTWMLLDIASYIFYKALEDNIFLRGVITYGEFLVSDNPLCFIGKPIIEALFYERKQEWCGYFITDKAMEIINMSNHKPAVFYKYKIKFKKDVPSDVKYQTIEKEHIVINPYMISDIDHNKILLNLKEETRKQSEISNYVEVKKLLEQMKFIWACVYDLYPDTKKDSMDDDILALKDAQNRLQRMYI